MTGKLVAALGLVVAALAADSIESARQSPAFMTAEDGQRYLVDPHETLGEAVTRGATAQDHEEGHCVPETLEKKPPGSVACTCYEVTECKGNESRQCKRHCRKDLCECCAI
ncbi:MAG TPA: hypothetical protein VLK65_01945 [Vicinamibacteria bacterium]|nr:hypothetical protein [Vicinamibacteria bacterium]